LQSKTKLEKISLILKIQDLIHNPYIFKIVIPLPHTFEILLFIRINITDFFKRFEDMATDYGLSDNRKI